MKVKDLIAILQAEDPESLVVLQKDSEGNGYSPLSNAAECMYFPINTWSGDCPASEDVEEMDEEDLAKGVKAVVLWPIN